MTIYGLLTFCAVYALAVATPGPGIAAVIARSLAHGLKGAPAFIAGFMAGDLIWFAIAATGLAALAKTAATLFIAIKWAGVAYLLFLAWKLWSAPAARIEVAEQDQRPHGWRAFVASLMLTLANPKAILFFLALLPTVIDLPTLNAVRFLEISAAMCVVLPAVLATYAFLAARARQLFTTPKAVRRLNRSSGIAMAGAAVVVATR
ncbi:MAG TPA: LysE family translocator [Steroidobacteraceae bacterium]|jgi:threonine/homoserine/homoserine lactone efflux protein|nr:LysE family translocator [Steroidobacteraceae bacterium]